MTGEVLGFFAIACFLFLFVFAIEKIGQKHDEERKQMLKERELTKVLEDREFQRDAKLILREAFIASLGELVSSEWISSFSNESIDSGAFRRGEGYRFTLSAKVERDGWSRLRRDPNSDQAAWRSELLRVAKVIAGNFSLVIDEIRVTDSYFSIRYTTKGAWYRE